MNRITDLMKTGLSYREAEAQTKIEAALPPARPQPCSPTLRAAEDAVLSVIRERQRQDAKWGEQNHDAGTWALIFLEEIGEWAQAELHARFGGPEAGQAHKEAIHMTAVALAVIECMNRKTATVPTPTVARGGERDGEKQQGEGRA